MHLLLTNCKNTSSEADRPTLLNIALMDRWKERFALSRKHNDSWIMIRIRLNTWN